MKILPYMLSEASGFDTGVLVEITTSKGKTIYGIFLREITNEPKGVQLADYSIHYEDEIENIRPLTGDVAYWNLASARGHDAAIADDFGITWYDLTPDDHFVDSYGSSYKDNGTFMLRPWWAIND